MLSNVNRISISEYVKLLQFSMTSGGNLLALGMAGIGKTECPIEIATSLGYKYIYLNLSVLEYPDLVGLQTVTVDPSSGRKFVEYASPKFLPLLGPDADPGRKKNILILDELDKAKDELQNPLLELLQFRRVNGQPVDIHACVATGNLPDEGAFSRPISHALTNRCLVYKVECEFEAWRKWATGARVNPLVVGFLIKNKDWLAKPFDTSDPTAYSRPSPRSWSLAGKDVDFSANDKTASKEDLTNFQTSLVAGRVGVSAAVKFKVWLEHYRFIEDAVDALLNEGRNPHDLTLDRLFVFAISAVSGVVRKYENKTPNAVKAAHNVFEWLLGLPPDIQVVAIKSSITEDFIKKHKILEVAPLLKIAYNIRDAIQL